MRNTYLITKIKDISMIQIPDWVVIATILCFFFVCFCYLVYFIKSKKLFVKMIEFDKEIDPNNSLTILAINGSGIIKKMDIQTSENNNSSIVLTIDQTAYTTFSIVKDVNNSDKARVDEKKERLLKLEVNFDKKFQKGFSIFIDNRSDVTFNSAGKIIYEIKKL
jgi:hypothetical protein